MEARSGRKRAPPGPGPPPQISICSRAWKEARVTSERMPMISGPVSHCEIGFWETGIHWKTEPRTTRLQQASRAVRAPARLQSGQSGRAVQL